MDAEARRRAEGRPMGDGWRGARAAAKATRQKVSQPWTPSQWDVDNGFRKYLADAVAQEREKIQMWLNTLACHHELPRGR